MANNKFSSNLEKKVAMQLVQNNTLFQYEKLIIFYMKNFTKESHYKPDFILNNGVIIEVKGAFNSKDRRKHRLIKEQYGNKYDIRFLFSDANKKIGNKSQTSYGDWCDIFGFKFAEKQIPKDWLKEGGK